MPLLCYDIIKGIKKMYEKLIEDLKAFKDVNKKTLTSDEYFAIVKTLLTLIEYDEKEKCVKDIAEQEKKRLINLYHDVSNGGQGF